MVLQYLPCKAGGHFVAVTPAALVSAVYSPVTFSARAFSQSDSLIVAEDPAVADANMQPKLCVCVCMCNAARCVFRWYSRVPL